MKIKVLSAFNVSLVQSRRDYSFINLASISNLFNKIDNDLVYFVDGFLLCVLFRFALRKHVKRISFDFTSIAADVFQECEKKCLPIYFIGASSSEIINFIDKIKRKYPNMIISGYSDGYYKEIDKNRVFEQVLTSNASVVIAGLGAGKQEVFIHELRAFGFNGTSFTCGGFIRQESGSIKDYYPAWINKLSLRAFYRMYKEPHTVKRYLFDYPKNALIFLTSKNKLFDVN